MSFLAQITWDVSPEIFSLGPVTVRWYGLLFAASFLLGYQILKWIFETEKKSLKDLESLVVYLILATVIGARLGHCLFYNPEYYLMNPIEILKVWEGGLASHGATMGIVAALLIFSKKKGYDLIWLFDRVVIVGALTAVFVRLGNFFNSEIVGMQTDVPWAVVFPLDTSHAAVPRHPSQLYEALAYIVTFTVLFLTYKKFKMNLPKGLLVGIALLMIFVSRFFIEYYKENQSAFESGWLIDMGQILSIPFILLGIYFIVRVILNRAKTSHN